MLGHSALSQEAISSVPVAAATAATDPFVPVVFDAPSRRVRASVVFDLPNLLLTTLAPAPDALPFNNVDWSQPHRAAIIRHQDQVNLLITTLAPVEQAPFFNLQDYPQLRPVTPRNYDIPNILANLFDIQPFHNDQTVIMRARVAPQMVELSNLLVTTLAPEEQAPFTNIDLNDRVYRVRQVRDLTYQVPLVISTTPAEALPFDNSGVGNLGPGPQKRGQVDFTLPNLLTTTLFVPPSPPTDRPEVIMIASVGRLMSKGR